MLKTSTVTNVWKCDNCGLEETSQTDPFYSVSVTMASMPLSVPCAIDLCTTCVDLITIPAIVTYVAGTI